MVLGQYQSQINELTNLSPYRYENIFRLYKTKDSQYFYNILQSIYISGEIDQTKVYYLPVKEKLPWTNISYNAYGTTDLWWLIALTNKIYNPVIQPEVGTILKVIRPEYVQDIISEVTQALK